ncbi:MAG: matrixin family metalloprotease [Bdellovibrio sp.]|nr:matrixin family metalloprotease [Bdellovibrio sp.]
MWKWLGLVLLVTSALFVQACAPKSQEDCGFVKNVYGERISWKSDVPVTLYIHKSVPPEYVGAIVNAADTWEKTAGRRLFNIVTSPRVDGPAEPHKDGKNVIYFLNSWESNRASEQARTSVYWVGDQIKEADIRVNDLNFNFYWNQGKSASAVNIEALILHEMGHVLGLKHKDTGGSVMATYLPSALDRTELANVDTADLKCEY